MSRVQKIIDSMKNKVEIEKTVFRPIVNFDSYIRSKIRSDMFYTDGEKNIERIVSEQNRTYKPRPPKKERLCEKKFQSYDQVNVSLVVSSDNKVKVKIVQPFVYLYENYFNKGIMPPINEYIIYLKHAGYSIKFLERVYKDFKTKENRKPLISKYIDTIWGKKN